MLIGAKVKIQPGFPHTSPSPARMYALDILQAHFEARELIVGITHTDCFALLQFSPPIKLYLRSNPFGFQTGLV
jgi:hypothetical protein